MSIFLFLILSLFLSHSLTYTISLSLSLSHSNSHHQQLTYLQYPRINELCIELHKKHISTFMVTNAQFPEAITNMVPVTQLYVSIDAATKESLKAVDRPLFKVYMVMCVMCVCWCVCFIWFVIAICSYVKRTTAYIYNCIPLSQTLMTHHYIHVYTYTHIHNLHYIHIYIHDKHYTRINIDTIFTYTYILHVYLK